MSTSPLHSLVDLLRLRAAENPDRPAYTFLADGEREAARLSYAGVDAAARAVGATLRAAGCAGERVVLLYPQGLDFVAAFWGCLYGGAVAVPAYPPRGERGLPRLRAIMADAEPYAVLTTRALLDEVRPWFGEAARGLRWIATDEVDAEDGAGWRDPQARPDTLAFLQYTSGSTATPKGVMVSHGNLLHNLRLLQEGWRQGDDSVVVSWLPLFHDMGLIGNVLEAAHLGAPCILMSPAAFLQRPFRWLDAVSRYGATLSGGPNFAFDLAVRRTTAEERAGLDLSRWSAAFNGAEPVRRDTLDRFFEAFAPCGLRREALQPGYGLAEGTLVVSAGRVGRTPPLYASFSASGLEENRLVVADGPGSRVLVGCGRVLGGQTVAVVDPDTRTACPPGRVGEIWLRGESVAQGYWRRPQETAETFCATVAEGDGTPFLRTGDLGFVHGGELFVSGRAKDLVIVRGRNHYPQDLELTAERAHAGVRPECVAAFTMEAGGEERLVVACELERAHLHGDHAAIAAAVREGIVAEHEVQPHRVVLLKTGRITKTTSGKIQRRACRAALLAGELEVVFSWSEAPPRDAPAAGPMPDAPPCRDADVDAARISAWLAERIAERTGLTAGEVDHRAPFARFGIDSVAAVGISAALESWLGRALAPTLLYDHPSIGALSRWLAGGGEGPPDTPAAAAAARERPDRHAAADEPVAIIGVGCRFPGADGPEAFWRLLEDGTDAVREVPADRWDLEDLYDADPGAPGKMTTRWGGFLSRVDEFDADFFAISPREAARMDPQQRLLLEVAWEALEDAGMDPERLAGTSAGVFVGISGSDYGQRQFTDPALSDAYAGTGGALSIAANRISYVLDLRGPSLAVDTACSSSLVALHLAVQSLRAGECGIALVGGANLLLSPQVTVNFSKAGFMSPDGRCRAFDARANGYVRGEGAGAVVLKPLSRALADGDPVYAVVRGTAVNQDGRSNGLTAPSGDAQAAVLRAAWAAAGADPRDAQYVEAHGTGTALGDPIEARSLGSVLGAGRPAERPCRVGSVKSNIGHLEAAAGIAGLVKLALSLRRRLLPATLHFERPNPAIPFAELGLEVQRECTPWPAEPGSALAGISSFGFGGTNAHAVLGDAPLPAASGESSEEPHAGAGEVPRDVLIPISARDPRALREMAALYRARLAAPDAPSPVELAHAAALRRAHHDERIAVVGSTRASLLEALDDFASGVPHPRLFTGRTAQGRGPATALVFCGQGAQWWAMGRELVDAEPVFRRALEEVAELLHAHVPWSLMDELAAGEDRSRLAATEVAQPAIFALQVALAALWRSWGIVPAAVAGHSVGEVAAAHVAGALTLADAVALVFHRGRLMQGATGRGAMAAVGLTESEARAILLPYGESLAVAAVNAPGSVVLSGERPALEEVLTGLERREVFVRRMHVDYAFHGAQVHRAADELADTLGWLEPRGCAIPLASPVCGRLVEGRELDAAYWRRNVREPVRWDAALRALAGIGCHTFVEVGPHPVLGAFVRRTLAEQNIDAQVFPSLRRGEPERETMLGSLGALYVRGAPVDWRAVHPAARSLVRLPRYPWQRERHWMEPSPAVSRNGPSTGPHPLLGAHQGLAHLPGNHLWETVAEPGALARLGLDGEGAVPAAVLGGVALAAAAQAVGPGGHALAGMETAAPLDVGSHRRTVQVTLAIDGGAGRFSIHGRPVSAAASEPWTLHASGHVVLGAPGAVPGWDRVREPAPAPPSVREEAPLPGLAEIQAAGVDGGAELLDAHLRGRLAAVLRTAPERLDGDRPVKSMGLDSLMAMELKNAVERDLGAVVPLRALLGGASLRELGAALLPQLAAPAALPGACGDGPPEEGGEGAPLSYAQRPMWLLQQLNPASGLFNVFAALRIRPAPDPSALGQALNALVERHAALRTVFAVRDGRPLQQVRAGVGIDLPLVDATAWTAAELTARLADDAHRPFDLERAPLVRAALYQRGDEESVLLLSMHHAAVDFWSNVLLLNDLAELYRASASGAAPVLAPVGAPFTAWAHEEVQVLTGPAGERMWAYWSERLAGASPAMTLPTDRRGAAPDEHAGVLRFRLGAARTRLLRTLADEHGTTLYVALLAVWHAMLHRWSGSEDVLVASPMAARGAEWEATVGCFMNMVLLRGDLTGEPTYATLLERTRETVLGALEHQSYPLHLLAERIPGLRDGSTGAPARAMFVFNRPHRMEEAGIAGVMAGEPGATFTSGGLAMAALPLDERTTPCDLCLWACEADGDLSMRLQYAAALFTGLAAERMAEQLRALVDAVLANPGLALSRAPLLTGAEREGVLAWGAAEGPAPGGGVAVHAAFAARAALTPDAPALAADAEVVSYADLDARANRLAHHLAGLGVRQDETVGLSLERGPEQVVALLAILKAGAAYLPLDPAYPEERLEQMLADAGARVLVGRGGGRLGGPRVTRVRVDADRAAIAARSVGAPAVSVDPDHLAYVIYTSGSTGRPKGAMVSHLALANHTASAAAAYALEPADRVLQFASLSFDASAEEIFPALTRGACLVLRPDRAAGSIAEFVRFCGEAALTVLDLPTAFWHQLAAALAAGEAVLPGSVRLVVIGGERALPERIAQWNAAVGERCVLVNTYGPTEATIVATRHRVGVEDGDGGELPIGRAIHGASARVLDRAMQPLPAGVPGELFVGGRGVARGYLGQPGLTAERFVPDPFAVDPGARAYATGDLARLRGDGSLEFAGRVDQQVKVRGYRIEPGEVEAALRAHPEVRDAAVVAPEAAPGERRLVAHVVPRGRAPSQRELREFLGELLPAHMVPGAFHVVRELPLTPSGKVDRRTLLAAGAGVGAADEEYVPPTSNAERVLAEVWAAVLGRERVGVRESFFAMGGDSIGAMQVVARARAAGVEVSPRLLFAHPTIARLAAALGDPADPAGT